MEFKKQLNKQAILFSLILLMPWLSFAALMINPEVINIVEGDTNRFKYMIMEQMIAITPVFILVTIITVLNYLLKPDLSRYFKIHIMLGLITNLICILILISFSVLSRWADGNLFEKLVELHIHLFWFVPMSSLLMEIIWLINQRVHQKPKEMIILSISNTGMCWLITYVLEFFIIGSYI